MAAKRGKVVSEYRPGENLACDARALRELADVLDELNAEGPYTSLVSLKVKSSEDGECTIKYEVD